MSLFVLNAESLFEIYAVMSMMKILKMKVVLNLLSSTALTAER